MNTLTFGQTLQSMLKKKNLKQKDVCEQINLDRSYFCRLIKNRISISSQKLDFICKAIGCNAVERMTLFVAANKLTPESWESAMQRQKQIVTNSH